MRFAVPQQVSEAVDTLEKRGFQAFLVGGCVRDDLLNIKPHDYDVTTDASPDQIKQAFSGRTLILAGEKHGTVAAVIDGMVVEMTTFRVDGAYFDGRHPDSVTFTTRLEDDLARRDFTINAMAWSKKTGLVDPFGGQRDCALSLIRCVGDPEKRLTEDALRILRGMRFSSRFGFAIEEKTAQAMRSLCGRLNLVSRERIAAELTGILLGAGAENVLCAFSDVLGAAVPELVPMFDCPQNSVYHVYDVWQHTLRTLSLITPRSPLTVYAALLHDCGKPASRERDARGFDHFHGHQEKGAALAEKIMRTLKLPVRLIRDVCLLILHHDDDISVKTVRLLLHLVGPELFDSLLALRRADMLAHAPFVVERAAALQLVAQEKERVLSEGLCYSLSALRIDGRALKRMGFCSDAIGEELNRLLYLVMTDALPNDETALLKAAESDARNAAAETKD